MTATDDGTEKTPTGKAPTGRDAVDRLRSQGALDGLFEQIDAGQVKMTGTDGLLPALVKEALERGLSAELSEHLGYDKGEPTAQARGNARNGTTPKDGGLVRWGPSRPLVPRDRAGTFTPRPGSVKGPAPAGAGSMRVNHQACTPEELRRKGYPAPPGLHRRCGAERRDHFEDPLTRSLTLPAGGSAARWTSPLPWWSTTGADPGRWSASTTGSPPARPTSRWEPGMDGIKHVLGIWVQAEEGASFWAHVCARAGTTGASRTC